MEDYQWPQPALTQRDRYEEDITARERGKRASGIENFFKDVFNSEVILVPSGRSAIAILLKYLGINRSHTVFTPKWTSTCVFDVIGHVSNPNTIYTSDCDVAIAVHKWGKIAKFSAASRAYLIEDSVDSIITSPDALFPNGGEVEIFSLPKMIGSYTGGLIAVRSATLAEKIRASITVNEELARHQSKLRFDSLRGVDTGFSSWLHLEYMNTSLDYNGLRHVETSLPNYAVNRRCIEKRLEVARRQFKDTEISSGRLPPVIPLQKDAHRSKHGTDVMVRHYSYTGLLDKPEYQEAYIVPLHFGVSDEKFDRILGSFHY